MVVSRVKQNLSCELARVAPDEKSALAAAAARTGHSKSRIIREALRAHLGLPAVTFRTRNGWPEMTWCGDCDADFYRGDETHSE